MQSVYCKALHKNMKTITEFDLPLGKFLSLFGGQQERCGEMFQFKWMLGKMKGYRAVYAVALCLSVVIQSFFLTGPMIVEQIISIFISSPDALKNI